jgi:hypothetical protein
MSREVEFFTLHRETVIQADDADGQYTFLECISWRLSLWWISCP